MATALQENTQRWNSRSTTTPTIEQEGGGLSGSVIVRTGVKERSPRGLLLETSPAAWHRQVFGMRHEFEAGEWRQLAGSVGSFVSLITACS